MVASSQVVAQDGFGAAAGAPALVVAERLVVRGAVDVVEPQIAGRARAAALDESVGTTGEPVLRHLEADILGIAAAIAVAVPYRAFDVRADDVPEPLGQRRPTAGAVQVVLVVVGHPAALLLAHRVALVAEQPAD